MKARAFGPGTLSLPQSGTNKGHRLAIGAAIFTATVAIFTTCAAQISQAPSLWAALGATTIWTYAAYISDRPWVRALWVNLAVLALAFGAGEAYFWAKEPLERRMQYSEGFFVADGVLGYKPAAGQTLSHHTSIHNELLYQVNYTIDPDGLRIAAPPNVTASSMKPCLVFFGDSFTFGEGMPDEHTMPYQVWKKLNGQYRTVNFGFLGYGPHQMLASLQHGHLESQGRCRPSRIIYQAIPTHVSRAAGLEAWDQHGPRYLLNAEGRAQLNGRFDDVPRVSALDRLRTIHRQLPTRLKTAIEQSALYRMLLRSHRPVDRQDIALFGGIMGEANQLISRNYPGSQLHVIFWDYDDDQEVVEQVQQELAHRGVRVSTVSTILPGFPTYRARYEISPHDRHPNALAHEIIAEFIAHTLVQPGR